MLKTENACSKAWRCVANKPLEVVKTPKGVEIIIESLEKLGESGHRMMGYNVLLAAEFKPLGNAVVKEKQVRSYMSQQNLHAALRNKGLADNNLIANIAVFYPLPISRDTRFIVPPKFGRKGVGSSLLKKIQRDCENDRLEAIHCSTIRKEMTRLLQKSEFERIRPSEYLKIL